MCTPFDALKVVMSVLLVLETKAKSLELFRLPPSIFSPKRNTSCHRSNARVLESLEG